MRACLDHSPYLTPDAFLEVILYQNFEYTLGMYGRHPYI